MIGGAVSFICPYKHELPVWTFGNSNVKNNHEVVVTARYSTLIINPVTMDYSEKIICSTSLISKYYNLELVGKLYYILRR